MTEDRKKEAIDNILSKSKSVSFNNLIEIRNVKKILIAAICTTVNYQIAIRLGKNRKS